MRHQLMKVFGMMTLLLVFGCMPIPQNIAEIPGMPGYINEKVSQFDDARELVMVPAWTDGPVRLGLFWRSTMPDDSVHVRARLKGAHNIDVLRFNVDGEFIAFDPVDSMTNIWTEAGTRYTSPTNWSEREYEVSRQFIERIISAERVVVRLDTTQGYMEGVFSTDYQTARQSFRRFHSRVWGGSADPSSLGDKAAAF